MKKVLLIIAHDGFQPKEYSEPKKILLANEIDIVTASDKRGAAISAYTNESAQVDLILPEVVVSDYSGIFIIGGPGAMEHLDNNETYRIMREAQAVGILYGAICISPRILARAGVLQGKEATGWNEDSRLEEIFSTAKAFFVGDGVIVDGKLITANGPQSAQEFGQTILQNI